MLAYTLGALDASAGAAPGWAGMLGATVAMSAAWLWLGVSSERIVAGLRAAWTVE